MRIRNQKDFWSAVMFVIFGVLFIAWSTDYQFGTTQRMGPGYFPTILGILLVLLGILVALPIPQGRRGGNPCREDRLARPARHPWLGDPLCGPAAATRIRRIAMVSLVIISAMASKEFTWKAALLSVIVLGAFSYLVFVKGLELQFPVWPTFLTR